MVAAARPLILLSPAKSLNFDKALAAPLAAAAATTPTFLNEANALAGTVAALSKAELKKLMSLSDSLAALNHERYANFATQPSRLALGAFEGAPPVESPPLLPHAHSPWPAGPGRRGVQGHGRGLARRRLARLPAGLAAHPVRAVRRHPAV